MGEAKRRRSEIDAIKRSAAERRTLLDLDREDNALLKRGIDPVPGGVEELGRLTRILGRALQEAKRNGSIAVAAGLLREAVHSTFRGLSDVPVACRRGCSHCCYIWVSVSPLEALDLAAYLESSDRTAIDRVRHAHATTASYSFTERQYHPTPCPLLVNNECSIYSRRPSSCAMAGSADAEVCRRTFANLTTEDVPIPFVYVTARGKYAFALSAALRSVGRPAAGYELNAAVSRALDTDRAIARWLDGEDIFRGVPVDPDRFADSAGFDEFYRRCFGDNAGA